MNRALLSIAMTAVIASSLPAQDYVSDGYVTTGPEAYTGGASVGAMEPLYSYDDQEPWKHGYLQIMPYYGGHHTFRPYNYHHVFNQSQTAAGWGMNPVLPYSQQFWARYEAMTDLSKGDHSLVAPLKPPVEEWNHYPKPINPDREVPMPGTSVNPMPMPQPTNPVPGPSARLMYETTAVPARPGRMPLVVPTQQSVQPTGYQPAQLRQYLNQQ